MIQTWCVATGSGARYLVDHDGNGGFGPVSVYDNGWLVHPRYRHTFASQPDCPTCLHREHVPADSERSPRASPAAPITSPSRCWRACPARTGGTPGNATASSPSIPSATGAPSSTPGAAPSPVTTGRSRLRHPAIPRGSSAVHSSQHALSGRCGHHDDPSARRHRATPRPIPPRPLRHHRRRSRPRHRPRTRTTATSRPPRDPPRRAAQLTPPCLRTPRPCSRCASTVSTARCTNPPERQPSSLPERHPCHEGVRRCCRRESLADKDCALRGISCLITAAGADASPPPIIEPDQLHRLDIRRRD
jgi:hypothetical protein